MRLLKFIFHLYVKHQAGTPLTETKYGPGQSNRARPGLALIVLWGVPMAKATATIHQQSKTKMESQWAPSTCQGHAETQ